MGYISREKIRKSEGGSELKKTLPHSMKSRKKKLLSTAFYEVVSQVVTISYILKYNSSPKYERDTNSQIKQVKDYLRLNH